MPHARLVTARSLYRDACTLCQRQSSSTSSSIPSTPGHSPGHHQRAYLPLLHDIGGYDPLFNLRVLDPHGKSDICNDHSHVTGSKVKLRGVTPHRYLAKSGVTHSDARDDCAMIERIHKHFTVVCRGRPGYSVTDCFAPSLHGERAAWL